MTKPRIIRWSLVQRREALQEETLKSRQLLRRKSLFFDGAMDGSADCDVRPSDNLQIGAQAFMVTTNAFILRNRGYRSPRRFVCLPRFPHRLRRPAGPACRLYC